MRKSLILFMLTVIAGTLMAQIDVANLTAQDIDLSKVNLSNAKFYVDGPMEIYVDGILYGDYSYAAVLKYSGGATISVGLPRIYGSGSLPSSIDISDTTASFTANGVQLDRIVLDGYSLSAALDFVGGARFQVAGMVANVPEAAANSVKIDLANFPLSAIDFSQVDLSGAKFRFEGPMDIYVDSVQYAGENYAGILKYDGAVSVAVQAADEYGDKGRPNIIDISKAKLALNDYGVVVSDIDINGRIFSAALEYLGDAQFAIAQIYIKDAELVPAVVEVPAVVVVPVVEPVAVVDEADAQAREIADLKLKLAAAEKQQAEMAAADAKLQREITAYLAEEAEYKRMVEAGKADYDAKVAAQAATIANLQASLGQVWRPLPSLPVVAQKGFVGGSPVLGAWSAVGTALAQTDTKQLFGKFLFPITQNQSEYVYNLKAKADEDGWVGYGYHFAASDSKSVKGYGYGKSFLLWFTRDPKMQTDKTYIQLYQSFNDVHMIELYSGLIDLSINQPIRTSLHAELDKGLLSLYVNDAYMITVPAALSKDGVSVALRALGKVSFEDFSVQSK